MKLNFTKFIERTRLSLALRIENNIRKTQNPYITKEGELMYL